ncbi:MAG: hypothetical protein R3321_11775 [Nitrososphaeraceae archaeon]|nr:hypothetical protein [Nitrososphaeraceae archaeon]
MHYWLGAFCRNLKNYTRGIYFPTNAVAISDTLTLLEDIGNNIPDKSWMLYLLEFFNSQKIPAELNLICQFDGKNYFEAIFNGVNRYKFKNILPTVGKSYTRILINDKENLSIRYLLIDRSSNESEEFNFKLDGSSNCYYDINEQFTGIEWWNKMGYYPYNIRYKVQFSEIMFGVFDTNSKGLIFVPYTALIPDKDKLSDSYPISFSDIMIKNSSGIHYNVTAGICNNGIRFNC